MLMIRWWVSRPTRKGLFKTLVTKVNVIKVRTSTGITTIISMGTMTGTGSRIDTVNGEERQLQV